MRRFLVGIEPGELGDQALFLQRADSLRADLEGDFFAVYHDRLVLEVWLPDLLGVALAKTDIVAKLFAFTGEFTLLHNIVLDSGAYCT
jgi:hypothetical protein